MLRPSAVSSASDVRCAASANASSLTQCAGIKREACRLPCVMVPVLSSSRTSISPAASTARPDMATTLERLKRLMPAMPIAESKAPMVVGARHTNKATNTVMDITWPRPEVYTLYAEYVCNVATTSRKISVSASQQNGQRQFHWESSDAWHPRPLQSCDRENWHPQAGNAHDQPIGDHFSATGYRVTITAAFTHHGRAFRR